MTSENIQYQIDMYRTQYDTKTKQTLINSMTLEEKENFFFLLGLQKYFFQNIAIS